MPQPKAVIRFALLWLVIYSPLAFLPSAWPAWKHAYAELFRTGGNAFFSQFWVWPQASVRFLDLSSSTLVADIDAVLPDKLPPGFKPPTPNREQDTLLVLRNRHTRGSIGMLRTGTHMMGYGPTTVLIALLLATQVGWSRRGWSLVWGMLGIHLLIAVRLTVLVTNNGFAAPGKRYALFHPGPLVSSLLTRADEVLADNPTFAYVAPVCLWLLILLGFRAWQRRSVPPSGGRTAQPGRSGSARRGGTG